MDNMSTFAIVTTSLPESFLFVVLITFISCNLFERKEKFNFKKIGNILRFSTTVFLFICTSVTTRALSSSLLLNQAINLILAITILVFIYNINIHNAIIGFMLNIIIYAIIEPTCVLLVGFILNIEWTLIYKNDILRLLFSLPVRTIQIMLIFFIYKLPYSIIELKIFKYTKILKKIKNIYILLILCFLQIISIIQQYLKCDYIYSFYYTLLNIIVILVIFISVIIYMINNKRALYNAQNDELCNLMLIRDLLNKYENGKINLNIVNNTIDKTIENRK